jgi:hypothetical protein
MPSAHAGRSVHCRPLLGRHRQIFRSDVRSRSNKSVAHSVRALHSSPRRLTSRDDFNHCFLEQLLSGNSQMPNAGDDRGGNSRARQAAEDLFKPKQQTTRADMSVTASNTVLSAGEQPRRQPRIFTIQPPVPANAATPEMLAEAQPKRRRAATRRAIPEIPPSQFGRVRALTNYGMTRAEVAQLYGVTVDDIERIIKGTATPRRASAS